MFLNKKLTKKILMLIAMVSWSHKLRNMDSWFEVKIRPSDSVQLPFIKNSANECYYLDEFMPIPDNMVTGKSGPVSLRYYTYKTANYKEWSDQSIVLSFYSQDSKCWSLFEEFLVTQQ